MSSKDEVLQVPKLLKDGSNWVTYRERLRWALAAHGILAHIEGKAADQKGTETVAAEGTATSEVSSEATEKWIIDEAVAKQAIASTLPDSVFNRVRSKETAEGVWKALVDMFEERSSMLVNTLRRRMSSVTCGDNDDVRKHFDKLAEYYEKLAALGTDLPDCEYVSIIVASLPAAYDATVASVMAASKLWKIEPSPSTVISLVIDAYDARVVRNHIKPKNGNAKAVYYAGGDERGSKSKKKGSGRKCFNCGKTGHIKADCYAPFVTLQ